MAMTCRVAAPLSRFATAPRPEPGEGAMKKHHGADATAMYTPKQGHAVAVYTHKFKPEHYREGIEIITSGFPDAAVSAKQKRLNIFLKHASTHELVNISFFDEGAYVEDWHESEGRLATLAKLRPLLDGPIDVQVYEVERVVGVGE
jgi:hypothetical protein